ncbi:MAG TPA: tRNA (adenosine(37)-N6)-threonylcarbamoyltransferase complex ATPase subunit type 1 TsaE [Planctomycetota bacterium]|nr:tRNA (adenosine(37)-N6)-threonylcarbamoyltransferase complex ATPase subunit type 1 TsaE [Planctomycetota bacterium]
MSALTIDSGSAERTARLGALLGRLLAPGDVVALAGDLGAGKTVFAKGVAAGLGLAREEVRSPTFILAARHEGGRVPLVHVDAYRLEGPEALAELGLDEILDPAAAALIEWAPRVAAVLPRDRLEVAIDHAGATRRRLAFGAGGDRSAALLARFRQAFESGETE